MTIDSDKILHDLLNSLDSLEGIRPGNPEHCFIYGPGHDLYGRTARFFAPFRVR